MLPATAGARGGTASRARRMRRPSALVADDRATLAGTMRLVAGGSSAGPRSTRQASGSRPSARSATSPASGCSGALKSLRVACSPRRLRRAAEPERQLPGRAAGHRAVGRTVSPATGWPVLPASSRCAYPAEPRRWSGCRSGSRDGAGAAGRHRGAGRAPSTVVWSARLRAHRDGVGAGSPARRDRDGRPGRHRARSRSPAPIARLHRSAGATPVARRAVLGDSRRAGRHPPGAGQPGLSRCGGRRRPPPR